MSQRLSDEEVQAIRLLNIQGVPQHEIAKRYKTSQPYVSLLVTRKSRANLPLIPEEVKLHASKRRQAKYIRLMRAYNARLSSEYPAPPFQLTVTPEDPEWQMFRDLEPGTKRA